MPLAHPLLPIAGLVLAAAVAWFAVEKSRRRTHAMPGGLQPAILLPHEAEFELWHNAFSLCSKKVRMCLAEMGIEHASHEIDLVETGGYETLSRRFLAVNPAGLVPVLVHRGHPVYESHEILRYAAAFAAPGASLVPDDDEGRRLMDEWVHRSSLWGDDPLEAAAESAGNCVPGLTIPLFAAMIADIPARRIVEGLLFHRLKRRPMFFLLLKAAGLANLARIAPLAAAVRSSRAHMERHLDALEERLAGAAAGGGPWIAGAAFSLADVSWAVILDRLREAGWTALLDSPRRPRVAAWWQRIRERPAFRAAMVGRFEHELVRRGTGRIAERKAIDPAFRELFS